MCWNRIWVSISSREFTAFYIKGNYKGNYYIPKFQSLPENLQLSTIRVFRGWWRRRWVSISSREFTAFYLCNCCQRMCALNSFNLFQRIYSFLLLQRKLYILSDFLWFQSLPENLQLSTQKKNDGKYEEVIIAPAVSISSREFTAFYIHNW